MWKAVYRFFPVLVLVASIRQDSGIRDGRHRSVAGRAGEGEPSAKCL